MSDKEITLTSDLNVTHVPTGNIGEHMIVNAARASIGGDAIGPEDVGEKERNLIRSLVRRGHTSTLEHCTMTVHVDAPIFVAREWMRHRTQSFNEISGRYKELEPRFYMPAPNRPLVQAGKAMDYRREPGTPEQWRAAVAAHYAAFDQAYHQYKKMVEAGIALEVARNVLPVATYTQFYATANLNNWFKFVSLRADVTAQWEIRYLACQVLELLRSWWPTATDEFMRRNMPGVFEHANREGGRHE